MLLSENGWILETVCLGQNQCTFAKQKQKYRFLLYRIRVTTFYIILHQLLSNEEGLPS
jgi:hypothetical protein